MSNNNYYYSLDDNFVVRYRVSINTEYLKDLRKQIIDNCSVIKHKNYKTTKQPKYSSDEHIRNYHSQELGMKIYNDIYSQDEMEYLVDYDEYKFSRLVSIIDDLLQYKTWIISILYDSDLLLDNDEIVKTTLQLKEEIRILVDKGLYDEIDNLIQNHVEYLMLKTNENTILEKKYLKKIKGAINLFIEDKITLEEVEKVRCFFNQLDTAHNASNNLVRKLKKV